MTDNELFDICVSYSLEVNHIGKRDMEVVYRGCFGEYTLHMNPKNIDSESTFVKLLLINIEGASREAGESALKGQLRNLLGVDE